MRGEAGRSRPFYPHGRGVRAPLARDAGGGAFGGGTPPDVPGGATRAALAAAERANMSAKLALVRTDARRSSRRKMRRSSASRRLPRLARVSWTTNRARSFFSDWYPYATTPFRDTGESTVHDWTNIVTSFDARMDVLFHLVSPRSHEVARRPPPPSPRAPHPRARCPPRASHPRRRSRRSVSVSPPRTPRGVPTGVFWVARTGGPWSLPPPTVTPASPRRLRRPFPPRPRRRPSPSLSPRATTSTTSRSTASTTATTSRATACTPRRSETRRTRWRAGLLDDNLGPDDVRRDAALRLVLGDLREEIDRLLPPADFPVRPVRDARLLRGEPLLVAGNPRDTPAALLGRSLADPSPLNPSLLRAAPVAPARVPYAEQGLVGGFMQSLTWLFSTPHADNPPRVDDWLRCSPSRDRAPSPRRCDGARTNRRGRGTASEGAASTPRWIGRTARTTSGSCTNTARTRRDKSGVCEPRMARNRGAFERSRRLEFLRQQASYARPGRFTDEACAHGDGIRYVHDGVVVGERRWIRIRVSTARDTRDLYVWEYFARATAFFDSRRLLRRFVSTTSRERATTRIVSSFHSRRTSASTPLVASPRRTPR